MKDRFKNFTGLIIDISRLINKIKDAEMEKLGFKGCQVQCIFNLYESGGMDFSTLCKACHEDKGALSRSIKQLTDKKVVYVDESAEQKYKNKIRLTENGLKIGQIVNEKIDKYLEAGSVGVSEKSRQELYNSLQTICSNLGEICKKMKEER